MASTNSSHNKLELFLNYVKVLIWPIILIFFLLGNCKSINQIVSTIPNLLNNSKTISIAGISIEINDKLKLKSSPEIEEKLKALSPHDIDLLLAGSSYSLPLTKFEETTKNEYQNLISLGISETQDWPNNNGVHYIIIHITEEGKKVRDFLLEIIAEFTSSLEAKQ